MTFTKFLDATRAGLDSYQLEFSLSGGTPSFHLAEENIAGFQFDANLRQYQIKGFLHPLEDVFTVAGVAVEYGPDDLCMTIDEPFRAGEVGVHIAGTDPEDLNPDLSLTTAGVNTDHGVGDGDSFFEIHVDDFPSEIATVGLQGLTIESARLVASGFAGMTRSLSRVDIFGEISEAIIITDRQTGGDVPSPNPVLLITENVEIQPGGRFRSDVQGGGEVIREINGLTLGEGSTYSETTQHKPFFTTYRPQFYFRNLDIGPGASFSSGNFGGENDDQVIAEWDDITLRGGTLDFLSMDEAGADRFDLVATNVHVGEGSKMAIQNDGEDGGDSIHADVQATVDGRYNFIARGGNGTDEIFTTHELPTTHVPGSDDPPPAISLLIDGGNGNDDLTGWLIAPEFDDEWITALNDGGRSRDTCDGNIPAVNCEG